ncbi:putative endonuclease 4 [Hypsizygus marmoreus]|uniref:Apurinic-apyrimidinic endonuclease 1 n=1 Tax=Hypsizygus marmoreus TaxID=39966 RepID=A0A369JTC2_HYPMA|nr:putative endonuclease 4 [Hypsizygus marmoreus]
MAKTRRASALEDSEAAAAARPTKRAKLDEAEEESSAATGSKPKRKAASKNIDKTMFPERHGSQWKVGAHASAAGGVENAIVNAAAIGANAFALFVKSQRKWTSPALTTTSITSFKARMEEYGYSSSVVLPHGSYLINLGNIDADKREKSYECFLDDLKRCELLGLELYNFHPGSTVGAATTAQSISLIAECINRAHKETNTVTTVIENMAGAGNIIGGDFAHLADIIAEVEDKTRVGVCLDTCHMFAAGYDIRTKEDWDASLEKFHSQVGLSYLRGMHLNDSKTPLNSKRDRHENIGMGHIGLRGFHHILNDPRIHNIPLILETQNFETPEQTWAKEIEVLNKLSGLDLAVDEGEAQCSAMAKEIKDAIHHADKAGGKPKRKTRATRGGKKKRKTEDDESEEGDDDDDAC